MNCYCIFMIFASICCLPYITLLETEILRKTINERQNNQGGDDNSVNVLKDFANKVDGGNKPKSSNDFGKLLSLLALLRQRVIPVIPVIPTVLPPVVVPTVPGTGTITLYEARDLLTSIINQAYSAGNPAAAAQFQTLLDAVNQLIAAYGNNGSIQTPPQLLNQVYDAIRQYIQSQTGTATLSPLIPTAISPHTLNDDITALTAQLQALLPQLTNSDPATAATARQTVISLLNLAAPLLGTTGSQTPQQLGLSNIVGLILTALGQPAPTANVGLLQQVINLLLGTGSG